MRYMRILPALAIALTCVFSMAADLVDNPAYQAWAKYKPGTSITYAQESAMGGMNMTMDMTQTLAELTAESAVIDMSITSSMMPGAPQKQKLTLAAKVEPDKVQDPGKMPPGMKGEAKPLGKEKVKVGDKEYECQVVSFTGEQQGMKMEGKTWTSSEVPGHMVKTEMKATGGQGAQGTQGGIDSKMTLKSVTIKQ